MVAPAALSGTDTTNLSAHEGLLNVYLSYDPMTEVASAAVASFPLTTPFKEISTSGESGGWTTATRADMLAIITDSGGAPKGYYRLRAVPIVGTLYVEELDYGDNGLFTIQERASPIIAGDTISIRETYPPFAVKPFRDIDGTIYQDREIAVGTYNSLPESDYHVTINSRPGDYFALVANGATKAITAVVTAYPWPTSNGASYTYDWDYPASFTGVSGAATATLTANAPVGSHWIYCTITDSVAGKALTIKRWIRIHTPADPPIAIKILSNPSDTRDRTTRSASFTLVNSRAATIPVGTTCAIWDDATWNGADISTAPHAFVGFINSAPYKHRPVFDEEVLELIGVGGALGKLNGYPAKWSYSGATTTWEELPASLQNYSYAMRWLLRWRTANVLTRFNFTPFTRNAGLAERKNISVDTGSILSQLQGLAEKYCANVGSRSDGELISVLLPSLRTDRTGLVTRITITNSMYTNIEIQWRQRQETGVARYTGYVSNLATDIEIVAQAPGAQSSTQAGGSVSASDKVFDDETLASTIVGHALSYANNPYMRITLDMADNYDVIEAADLQRVVVQIPANRSPSGADTEITCIPVSVTKTYFGQRAKVQLVLEAETTGTPGQILPQVNSNEPPPEIEPPETPGTWGEETTETPIDETTAKGCLLGAADGYVVRGGWEDISPTDDQREALGTGIKLLADPHEYRRLIFYGSAGCLVCDDSTASSPEWHEVNLSASGGLLFAKIYDFSDDNGGWSAGFGGAPASYGSGRWNSTHYSNGVVHEADSLYILSPSFASTFITTVRVVGYATYAANGGGRTVQAISNLPQTAGSFDKTATINANATQIAVDVSSNDTGDATTTSGKNYVTQIVVTADADTLGGTPVTGGTDIEFIGDMVGSINREGWFGWLGTDGTSLYFYRTTNYWQTRTRVQLGSYVAGINYSISTDSYGASVVFVVAGSVLYKSTNAGRSFATTGISINASGGPINVPYALPDGAANAGSSPEYLLVKGVSGGNLEARTLAGNTVTLAAAAHYAAGPYALVSYTQDGNYLFFVGGDGTTWYTSNGGETWTQGATPTASGTVYGVNGSPQNKLFALVFGNGCLSFSANGMVSFTSLYSAYSTWATANLGSGEGGIIVSAFIDLNLLYEKEVTN